MSLCTQCGFAVSDAASGAAGRTVRICPRCHAPVRPPQADKLFPSAKIELGFARVVVDAKIGEGGMGIVWRGWLFYDPSGPRRDRAPEPVAIKVLKRKTNLERELRAMFKGEAEVLRKLSHPNIVRLYDLADAQGDSMLILEYVDGDTLEQVITRHVARARAAPLGSLPGMPLRRAWHYFQQLLGALASMHALGLVHGDVKPSNILIRNDGIVKLTDFGIARLVESESPSDPAFVPGTGAYMSPEQVLAKKMDGRSDLYSAAIVLYEMLSGRTPFLADRFEYLVRRDHVDNEPPRLSLFVPQAPPIVDELFARAFAKEPAHRFASAVEMGEAFRSALGLPENPEWKAQAQFAQEAKAQENPGRIRPDAAASSREERLATLREFVVQGYRTMKMASF